MSFWIRERDRSEHAPARKRSSRVPAEGDPTWKRRSMAHGGPTPRRGVGGEKTKSIAAGESGGEQADELGGREHARDHEAADEVAAPDLEDAAA